jgi:hypothetical protein
LDDDSPVGFMAGFVDHRDDFVEVVDFPFPAHNAAAGQILNPIVLSIGRNEIFTMAIQQSIVYPRNGLRPERTRTRIPDGGLYTPAG